MRYEYQERMNKAICKTYKVLREARKSNRLHKLQAAIWSLGCKYASCGYEGRCKQFEPLLQEIRDARNNYSKIDFDKFEKKLDRIPKY